MADPYLASNEFPGNGTQTLFNVSFKGNRPDAGSGVVPYLNTADVKAQLITPATATTAEVVVDVPCVYVGPNQFSVTPAAPVGKIVRIYRATQDEYALVDYQALQNVGEADLDLSNRQVIFVTQEAHDLALRAEMSAAAANTAAYSAIAVSNTAQATANAATITANSAAAAAATAVVLAEEAVDDVAAALAAAQSAEDHATAADVAAAAAQTAANTAVTTANSAQTAANTAVATANGVDSKAQTALDNSASAISIANGAVATADGVDAKAQTALDNSNTAIANAASATSTANTANTNASNAVATANATAAALAGKQDLNGNLTALSGLSGVADRLAYFTGAATLALTTFTAFARSLLAAATAASARTTLQISDGWATQPIGVPIPLFSNLTGTASPPTGNGYTYIKLTAADSYNTGLLTGETLSGSAPLNLATATINVAGSPINGQVVDLINTSRRFLRAGSAGTAEQDALQDHNHAISIHSSDTTAGFSAFKTVANVQQTGSTGNAGGRVATETRVKNIGVTYFMRVL